MTIKPQKEGESLEDRVVEEEEEKEEEEAAEEILGTLPLIEEAELAEVFPSTEPEEVPESVPVGPADYSSSTHIGPQVLEEATAFLDKYGIRTKDLSPKEVMNKIEKIKAAKEIAAQVLSRGRAIDGIERLLSFVPEGYVGEFKRENDMDIERAKALGFKVFESDEAKVESSTGKSDGLVRLGDQLLMIIPEETYVANRLVKAERLAERRKSHTFKAGAIDQKGADPLFPLIEL